MPTRTSVLFCLLWDNLFIKQVPSNQKVRDVSCILLTPELLVETQQQNLLPTTMVTLFHSITSDAAIVAIVVMLSTTSFSLPRIISIKLLIRGTLLHSQTTLSFSLHHYIVTLPF
jgi:spore maturation protein SpmA